VASALRGDEDWVLGSDGAASPVARHLPRKKMRPIWSFTGLSMFKRASRVGSHGTALQRVREPQTTLYKEMIMAMAVLGVCAQMCV